MVVFLGFCGRGEGVMVVFGGVCLWEGGCWWCLGVFFVGMRCFGGRRGCGWF